MFVREKTINGHSYLYLVESVREGKRTKQRIIKNLGRKEAVLADGGLERLAASISRFAASVEVRFGDRTTAAGLLDARLLPEPRNISGLNRCFVIELNFEGVDFLMVKDAKNSSKNPFS